MKKFYILLITIFTINIANAQWVQIADFGGTARYAAVGFSIDKKGYIGTGYDTSYTHKKDFWEYDQSNNTWTRKADFPGGARYGAVGFSIGTKGYIGTGSGFDSFPIIYKDFWEYDPVSNIWTQKNDFGGTARYSAVGFSIGTKGYIGTGATGGATNYKDFWEYDQSNDTWTQKTDFEGTERGYAVGFSIGTKGYIGTGSNGSFLCKDFWEYNTAYNNITEVFDGNKINIYPNPTKDNLTIETNSNSEQRLEILNLIGQTVYTK